MIYDTYEPIYSLEPGVKYALVAIKFSPEADRAAIISDYGCFPSRRAAEEKAAAIVRRMRADGIAVVGSARCGYVYGYGDTVDTMHTHFAIKIMPLHPGGKVVVERVEY